MKTNLTSIWSGLFHLILNDSLFKSEKVYNKLFILFPLPSHQLILYIKYLPCVHYIWKIQPVIQWKMNFHTCFEQISKFHYVIVSYNFTFWTSCCNILSKYNKQFLINIISHVLRYSHNNSSSVLYILCEYANYLVTVIVT